MDSAQHQQQQEQQQPQQRAPLLPWSESTWKRWSDQKRMCLRPVPRTKFILLKVPVSTLYEVKFGGDVNMFTVSMFVQRMISKNCLISAAVDCSSIDIDVFSDNPSSTSVEPQQQCYYYFHNLQEWDEFDIDYIPLTNSSKQQQHVPSDDVICTFIETCSAQWKERPNTHIAAFDCCAGLGAAAYLVVCYMVDKLRAPLHVALTSISEVLQPGIFDITLLTSLQTRCKGIKELSIPKAPVWATTHQQDEDQDKTTATIRPYQQLLVALKPIVTNKNDNTNNTNGNKRLRKTNNGDDIDTTIQKSSSSTPTITTATVTTTTIPGLEYCSPDSTKYQRAASVLQQLIGVTTDANVTHSHPLFYFPGCHQYPLTLNSLKDDDDGDGEKLLMTTKSYNVTWNPVGKRGLLLLLSDGVFFIEPLTDNKNNSTTGNSGTITISLAHGMFFSSPKDLMKPQHRTLLDGILVIDKEQTATTPIAMPRYLASDILVHEGGILINKPFSHRIKYLHDGVYGARKRYYNLHNNSNNNKEESCFQFRVKDTFELRKTHYLLSAAFLEQVTHDVDGLQFIPLNEPYIVGNNETNSNSNKSDKRLLVWKQNDGKVPETLLIQRIQQIINTSSTA